jgi:hypothetical protein
MFSERLSDEVFSEFVSRAGDESPLVGIELMGWRPFAPPPSMGPPLLVMGGTADRLITPWEVRATGAYYAVEPILVEDMAHAMMLEPHWHRAAAPILAWLNGRSRSRTGETGTGTTHKK